MSESSGSIRRMDGVAELAICAKMMAESEPWLTLRRSLEASIRTLQDPDKEVYVLEDDDEILGFVVVDLRGPFPGYLQTVCVRSGDRGEGHGERLITFAEERIFRDSPNVFMCVSTFNPDAKRLYERLGYTVVGEMPDYIVQGHGEILLRKTQGPWSAFGRR